MQVIQYAPHAGICQIDVPECKPISREDKEAYKKAKAEFAKARKAKKEAEPVEVPKAEKNKRFEDRIGALHIRPGATVHVSDDELTILKEAGIPFRVVADSKALEKSNEKAKKAESQKETKKPSEGSSGGSGSGGDDGSSSAGGGSEGSSGSSGGGSGKGKGKGASK